MNTKGKGRFTLMLFFVFKTEIIFYTIRKKKIRLGISLLRNSVKASIRTCFQQSCYYIKCQTRTLALFGVEWGVSDIISASEGSRDKCYYSTDLSSQQKILYGEPYSCETSRAHPDYQSLNA